ncbi:MAG: 4-hydroxy-tetrahydrodipicolinate reductase [Firmicutes bacterium]|nr:4-hydroxy-tetrahydrodipicolinate reductase [Bacillota bacterium]
MKILVAGSSGKMGQEVVRMIKNTPEFELVGGVDPTLREISGAEVFPDLASALRQVRPDVVVDFTTPKVVQENMEICLEAGVPMVVGTTGFTEDDLARWQERGRENGWRAIIAPNFAIGALLMMKFAREAARYIQRAEIIEYHHDQKKDAPSGTALRTSQQLEEVLGYQVPIHSVRLPGLVAHQEVIFGLLGQTLTIRHDSTSRESFMPGVKLAIENINSIEGVVIGLEGFLFSHTPLEPSHI